MLLKTSRLRRLCRVLHRDLGYFCAGLVVVYSLSGIALNHVDDWNPDFVIEKRTFELPPGLGPELSPQDAPVLTALVAQQRHRVADSPATGQLKLYYADATLHADSALALVTYERVVRRAFFYEANLLHRNSIKPWRWAADLFAVLLIIVTVTGLFLVKGRYGFGRRGVWWLTAGALPPALVLVLYS